VFVDERQKKLVIDFALERVSEEEFLRNFPASPEQRQSLGLEMLRFAASEKDADAVECGTILGYRFGMTEDYVDALNALALEDWHRDHEDVVFALGKVKSPTSVEPLFLAAQKSHGYLEASAPDDGDGHSELRSKCIHALGNIGTVEALARLEDLHARFDDPLLRAKIGRRYRHLAAHSSSEEVRKEAQAALLRAEAEGTENPS